MHGTGRTLEEQTHPVGEKKPNDWRLCTICMGMSGSGFGIGMERTRKILSKIRVAPRRAPAGFFAAVAGSTTPATAVRRIAHGTFPADRRDHLGFRLARLGPLSSYPFTLPEERNAGAGPAGPVRRRVPRAGHGVVARWHIHNG